MKVNKIIITTVIIVLLSSAVYAMDILVLTDKEAAETMAIENDTQQLIDDLKVQINEGNLEDAQEEADKNDYPGGDRVDKLNRSIIVKIDPLLAEADIEVAKMQKQDNLRELKKNVYVAMMEYTVAEKELKTEQLKLVNLKEIYSLNQAKYNSNRITETALLDVQYQVDNQEVTVLNLEDSLEIAKYELNRLLNQDLEQPFQIDEELKLQEFEELDLDNLQEYINDNTDVFQKQKDLEAAELKLELTAVDYDEKDKEYKEALYDKEIARLDLEDAVKNAEVNIKNQYNTLLTKKEQYELTVEHLELVKKNLNVAELKYNNGMAEREELLNVQQTKLDADFAKYKAIYEFNKATEELDVLLKK